MPAFNHFLFKIKPLPTNKDYGKVSGGCATVFVIGNEHKGAFEKAKDHVQKSQWEIVSVEIAVGPVDEVAATNPQIQFLLDNAKRFGVSCIYDIGKGGQFFN